jgi:O-acetylserine/cysteine efflux transporter
MAWLMQRHPITTVMPLTLGAPIIAVAGSAIAFNIVLTPVVIAGAVLTMIGVAIIALRSAAKGQPIAEPVQ